MKRKKLPVLMLAVLPLLSGCTQSGSIYANYRAVEDLQLVQTFGFDWHDGVITVTVFSGEETDKLPASVLSASAPDIPQAIELLQDWSAREDLYFAHIRYVLVGEEAAAHGLETLLDWFERGIQARLDLPVFVVEGGTARELISSGTDSLYEITSVLLSLERDVERRGSSWPFTLRELSARMNRSGAALCTSVRIAETGENVPSAEDGVTALETGFAVFSDWKLRGFSGRECAEGICLLLNKSGTTNILLPGKGEGFITLELSGAKRKLKPRRNEAGEPALHIELRCAANVVSADPGALPHEEQLQILVKELGEWMQQRTEAALALSRELGVDFLELGRLFGGEGLDKAALETLPVTLTLYPKVERSYDILFAVNAAETESHG